MENNNLNNQAYNNVSEALSDFTPDTVVELPPDYSGVTDSGSPVGGVLVTMGCVGLVGAAAVGTYILWKKFKAKKDKKAKETDAQFWRSLQPDDSES